MYRKFGKVRQIDASGSVNEVYAMTKKALLPDVFFLNGPKGSGKTTVGKQLAEKTNMEVLNFDKFIKNQKMQGKDDEAKVFKLIGYLLDTVSS